MRPLASRDLLGTPLRRLQVARGGACAVLIYHRVADAASDPQLQCTPVARFEEQMAVLAERFTPLPLPVLAKHLAEHAPLPHGSVAVTFDDGYADNHANALPILERYGVPATVFVNSGLVSTGRLGWVDELEVLLLGAPAGTGAPTPWDVTMPAATPRQAEYLEWCARLRTLGAAEREAELEALREATGKRPAATDAMRMLTGDELRAMAGSGLVTVGSHTADHIHMASMTREIQAEQVLRDKRALEEITGGTVDLFSYPYGGRADYGDDAVAAVREAGFTAACANHRGVANPWTDRYRIPRVSVRAATGQAFEEALHTHLRSGR